MAENSAVFQNSELTKDGHLTNNGKVVLYESDISFITKHRDKNKNLYSCVNLKAGGWLLIPMHPLVIRALVACEKPPVIQSEDKDPFDTTPHPPKVVRMPPRPTKQDLEFDDDFGTQVGK